MKYLMVSGLQGGGAERICVKICNSFVGDGYDVTLIIMKNENGPLRKLLDKRVQVVFLNKKNARNSFFSILKVINNLNPPKILCFNFELAVWCYISSILLFKKTKVILRVINIVSSNASFAFVRSFFYRRFYKIIFQCHEMKNDFISHFNDVDFKNTEIIYNPASFTNEIICKDGGLTFNIVFAGRFEDQKNLPLLIESFSIAYAENPRIRLYMYGEGSLKQSICELVERMNLTNVISIFPFQTDISQIFVNKQLSILTSKYEGFPNFLLDSISFGVPIVSINCKSGPSEIINSDNGLLVCQAEPSLIAKSILQASYKKWDSSAIRKDAKLRFGFEKIFNDYIKILN